MWVAFAVGVAWAMPLEHIVVGPWPTAQQVFPGLLLEEAVADGGQPDVTAGTVALTATAYLLVAAAIAAAVFSRRDVTA